MLIDVRALTEGQPCTILGMGHTVLADVHRYDNARFIRERLSDLGKLRLLRSFVPDPTVEDDVLLSRLEEFIPSADAKFIAQTGIHSRMVYPGSAAELGAQAAQAALRDAQCSAQDLDAILVGTNTGSGYPSTADRIKGLIGANSEAVCMDIQEACSVGAIVVQQGWEKIRSRMYRRVLVAGAEKASTLASSDEHKSANLFGDAAFAYVLGPGTTDAFIFFESGSDPSNDQAEYIVRTSTGFTQNGSAVHKYVGRVVPELLARTFERLQLDPATVRHFFPHQPSAKTLDFLIEHLQRQWPTFRPLMHRDVEEMGNTSGACTGWMIGRAHSEGTLQSGELCLVTTFGSGMSWGMYGFLVP